jgi:2-polyprenyl-3-methyl-5-hydroxy-6-metoxy-1,4-benzoquinol methylase
VPASPHERHLDAVRRDYGRRAEEWRGIYDGESFHDHTIRERLRRALELVARAAPPPAEVLDVGCGAGQLLVELARRGYSVSGCDLAEAMVSESRALLAREDLRGDVRQAEAEDLPYPDGRFQVVTALGVLEYLPRPEVGVRELARVLTAGGHVVVTAPNPVRLAYLADPVGVLRARLAPPRRGYRRRYWAGWQLRRLLERAGLHLLTLQGHGIGPLSVAGRPVLSDARSIRLGERLEGVLPERTAALLGADLVVLARKGDG